MRYEAYECGEKASAADELRELRSRLLEAADRSGTERQESRMEEEPSEEPEKTLTRPEESVFEKWKRGVNAIDDTLDVYRDGLREQGISDEAELSKRVNEERQRRLIELSNDLGF